MKIIRKEDTATTEWSGGTTTQLAICPEGAVYADRDFLWRLSTAEVLDEKSTFTKLPDYKRFLTTRRGELRIKHDDGEWYTLRPSEVTEFDGASLTLSEGRVTDFNLMLRKGSADGKLLTASLDEGAAASPEELFTDFMPAAKGLTTAVYVSSGGPVTFHSADNSHSQKSDDEEILRLGEGEMILLEADAASEASAACETGEAVGLRIYADRDAVIFCAQMLASDKL